MPIAIYNKQIKPTAGVLTSILLVPELITLEEIVACNESAVADAIRIMIKVDPLDPDMYIVYDLPLTANNTYTAEFRDYLVAGSEIKVYSANGTTSFSLYSFANNP